MEFVLGIFVGIGLCIAYGAYLSNQKKKEIKEQTEMQYKHFAQWLRYGTSTNLEQQLQDAIEREDFQEAARLRDLINKK